MKWHQRKRLPTALRGVCRGALLLAILVSVLSCAGITYRRTWSSEGSEVLDRLFMSGESFSLTRTTSDGLIVFKGHYSVKGDTWRFEIRSWKPASGMEKAITPPAVFLCRGHLFANGIAFFSSVVVQGTFSELFIPVPIDYDVDR